MEFLNGVRIGNIINTNVQEMRTILQLKLKLNSYIIKL